MAKVNLNNIKKDQKNQKKNSNQKKQNDKNKEAELKRKQKEANLINQAKQAINELEIEIEKSYRFNKAKKQYAISKVEEINNFIDQGKFEELEEWINTYKELKEEEKKRLEIEEKEKNNKLEKEPINIRFKKFFAEFRIPVYSRVKKIIKEDHGKVRLLKLLGVFGMILILIAVFIIGVLMLVGVIPFNVGTSNGASQIFPAILVAIAIGLFYFV